MAELDITTLLRDLGRALPQVRGYLDARREAPAKVAGFDPYERTRWASSRSTLEALLDRKGDPAAPYLSAWVFALLEGRVNREAEGAELEARESSLGGVILPAPERLSVRQIVRRMLGERVPELRGSLAEGLLEAADEPSARALERWARKGEFERRLGRADLDRLRSPLADPAGLEGLARGALGATDDLASATLHGSGEWQDALALGFGQEGDVPWPRQLSPRWLVGLFQGEAGWLDIPDLELGQLPPLLAGSSVTRAFARFGARWADAAASRQLPLPLAHNPAQMARLSVGALVAGLLRSPSFLTRRLGFSRKEAERTARSQVRIALVALRLAAARALILPGALAGDPRATARATEEHMTRALAAGFPPRLALVLPRLHRADPARLVAFGEGARLAALLRDLHDEDWYRNPKAVFELRDRLCRAPTLGLSSADAEAGMRLFTQDLLQRSG